MLNVKIPSGAIFYGKTKHRLDIEFNELLRQKTKDTALRLHDLLKKAKLQNRYMLPNAIHVHLLIYVFQKYVEKEQWWVTILRE